VTGSDVSSAEELRKIGNVLALMLVRDMPSSQKAATLSICGFSNRESAIILDTTEGSIRASLSRNRKGPKGAD
jgi:hypothetical protein